MKRYWGAYGNKPDDTNLGPYNPDAPPAQQFHNPVHCADVSNDGFVYVCDRVERSHAGLHAGREVREGGVRAREASATGRPGTSPSRRDPQQTYIYMADGSNEKVRVIQRETLEVLTASATADGSPGSSTACTASRPTRRATSIRPRPTKGSACRSSSTRASAPCRARRACRGRGAERRRARFSDKEFRDSSETAQRAVRLPFPVLSISTWEDPV